MSKVSRRKVLSAAPIALAGLAFSGPSFAQKPAQERGQARTAGESSSCLCTFQIPDLKLDKVRGENEAESRELITALVGAIAPVIVNEIVKAVGGREPVASSATRATLDDLERGYRTARGGNDGADADIRGLFSGSVSAPGITIGVVIG